MNLTTSDKIAFAEVDECLKIMDKNLVKKIPQNSRQIYTQYRDREHKVNLDITKPINEQKLSRKTLIYLFDLYLKYWCSDKKKEEFLELLDKNEKELKMKLEKQYDFENMIKLKNKNEEKIIKNKENDNICKYEKKNLFIRIWNKIKQIIVGNK